jgi:hypothetical protein
MRRTGPQHPPNRKVAGNQRNPVGHHDVLLAVSARGASMRVVERLTARQLFLKALLADLVYDSS